MYNAGDFVTTETVDIPLNTFTSDDPAASVTVTNLVAGDVKIHKDGSVTQRSSASGVTVSVDFDSITGNHVIHIDLSDNTDAGFYAEGSRYTVRIEGATVDAGTVNAFVGGFSIGIMKAMMAAALATYDPPTKAEMDTAHGLLATEAKQDIIDGIVDDILVDTGTTLQAEVDAIQAAVITNAAGVDIAADIIAIKAETATIVADTNELQTDNIPGTLSTIDGKIDAQDAIITEARLAELDAANLPADIAAIPTAAEVNAEVVDVMDTDTITLPGQEAPSNTPTITGVLGWVHKMLRNKKDNDGSTTQLYDDAGTTVDAKFTTTESGGTVTTGEIVSGP